MQSMIIKETTGRTVGVNRYSERKKGNNKEQGTRAAAALQHRFECKEAHQP